MYKAPLPLAHPKHELFRRYHCPQGHKDHTAATAATNPPTPQARERYEEAMRTLYGEIMTHQLPR